MNPRSRFPPQGPWRRRAARLLALAMLAAATAAQAGAVHFDFQATPDNGSHDALVFSVGGITVTVTAVAQTSAVFGDAWTTLNAAFGSYNGQGAGVYYGSSGLGAFLGNAQDSHDLDGTDGSPGADMDEALLFTFSEAVELTRVNFNRWTGRSTFAGSFNPYDGDFIRFENDGWGNFNWGGASDRPAMSLVGTRFMLHADDNATEVRIQDLDINTLPEPGTLALAGLALLGLALGRGAMARPGAAGPARPAQDQQLPSPAFW